MSEQGTYMVATLVDWHYPKLIDKSWKKLSKLFKNELQGRSPRKNQLNTFVIGEVRLDKLPNRETRIKVEEETKKILQEYAINIGNLHHNEYTRQGDITKTYQQAFESINKVNEFDRYFEAKQETFEKIEQEIENVGADGGVIIWDLPGFEGDKLILPEVVAQFEGTPDHDDALVDIIDEVLIANFGRRFLPFSLKIMRESFEVFQRLELYCQTLGDDARILDSLKVALQTFIGVISGIQEVLKLFKREVIKVHEIASEAFAYLASLPSEDLKSWATIKNPNIGSEIVELIDKTMAIIVENKPKLRSMLFGKKEIPQSEIDGLVDEMIEVDVTSGGLLAWVHRFQQLPSFTTLEDGIAYEKIEGEAYFPKEKEALIEAQTLFKTFKRGNTYIYALRGVDAIIKEGEFVIIRGPSGAGKTTLLNMLAGLDSPGRGAVFFQGEDIVNMKDKNRSKLRRENYSFIFQSYALIPHLTAFENTRLPLDMTGLSDELVQGIQKLLDDVGIGEYHEHKPALLSGGQMQRLGIARALANQPKILFADEPTGDLDEKTGQAVMDLLKKYHEEKKMTIILVTHDPKVATYATREIFLMDGRVVDKMEV